MKYAALIEKTFDVVSTSGEEYLCRCPWHDEGNRPNLYVNAVKGVYICHSCGAKGHMRSLGPVPHTSATELRERLKAMMIPADTITTYPEAWLRQFDFPHEAWSARGLTDDVIKKFGLGWDPFTDCLTIPIRDEHGKCLGVVRRRTDGQMPKYRYPKRFPMGRYLFGAWMLDSEPHNKVAVVEGSIDAIACWDARVPAVALLGSRLTKDQCAVLKRMGVQTVVLFMDNDRAGQGEPAATVWHNVAKRWVERHASGQWQVHEALKGSGISVQVAVYRPYWTAKDPAELRPDQRRKAFHSAVAWHRWAL